MENSSLCCNRMTKHGTPCCRRPGLNGGACHQHDEKTYDVKRIQVYEDNILQDIIKNKQICSHDYDQFEEEQIRLISKNTTLVAEILKHATCFVDFINPVYINAGSAGIVFDVTSRKDKNVHYALKISKPCKLWVHEIKCLKAFSNAGVGVKFISSCIVYLPDNNMGLFGVHIMQKVDGILMDYLEKEIPIEELEHIGNSMTDIFIKMKKANLTHGDLALFNIGYVNSTPKKLVLFDYDKAKTDRYYPDVDILRVSADLLTTFEGEIHETNALFLFEAFWKKEWYRLCSKPNYFLKLPIKTLKEIESSKFEAMWE